MTLYLKNGRKIQGYILDSLQESKAYLEIIELLSYCLSSDLRQVLVFFNQNLEADMETLEIDESLFKSDFLQQK